MIGAFQIEDVTFKTLVGVKWRDRHFHVIGEGFTTNRGTQIMLFRWTFPEGIPYEEGIHQIGYQFDTHCLKRVDHADYRYRCDETVDLDRRLKQQE